MCDAALESETGDQFYPTLQRLIRAAVYLK
jgi:hypothetical protein